MKALVTGSSGLVGSYLVPLLCADPCFTRVVGLSRSGHRTWRGELRTVDKPGRVMDYEEWSLDLAEEIRVRQLLRRFEPDIIFHLAAQAGVRCDEASPSERTVWAANVNNSLNVLSHAPQGCRFVLASSATVYGDGIRLLGGCREGDPLSPTSVYGASKVAAEALVRAFTAQKRIRGLTLRLVANVGKNARHGLLPDLVRKILSDAPELELLGDGPGSVKPYMHASDTARAMLYLAKKKCRGVVNICPDDNVSVGKIAMEVMKRLKRQKSVRWLGEKANFLGDNGFVSVSNRRLLHKRFRLGFDTSLKAVLAAVEELA